MNGFHSAYESRSASTPHTASGEAAISISVRSVVGWVSAQTL